MNTMLLYTIMQQVLSTKNTLTIMEVDLKNNKYRFQKKDGTKSSWYVILSNIKFYK